MIHSCQIFQLSTDLSGRILYNEKGETRNEFFTKDLSMSSFASGMYLITIYFEMDSVETDSATLATLYNIATQNAMQGGVGVYDARAMLNLDVQDYLQIGLRTRKNIKQEFHSEAHFKVSPNPANTKCTLTFYNPVAKHVAITDLIGKPVEFYSISAQENQIEIELNKLTSGSYTITVIYEGSIKETDILIVVH